jgi:hypothetical protein
MVFIFNIDMSDRYTTSTQPMFSGPGEWHFRSGGLLRSLTFPILGSLAFIGWWSFERMQARERAAEEALERYAVTSAADDQKLAKNVRRALSITPDSPVAPR